MEVNKETFPGHVISLHSDLPWPAHLPDFCEYLNGKVFVTKMNILDELKAAICQEIAAIAQDMMQCAVQNFQVKLHGKKWKSTWMTLFSSVNEKLLSC